MNNKFILVFATEQGLIEKISVFGDYKTAEIYGRELEKINTWTLKQINLAPDITSGNLNGNF